MRSRYNKLSNTDLNYITNWLCPWLAKTASLFLLLRATATFISTNRAPAHEVKSTSLIRPE